MTKEVDKSTDNIHDLMLQKIDLNIEALKKEADSNEKVIRRTNTYIVVDMIFIILLSIDIILTIVKLIKISKGIG